MKLNELGYQYIQAAEQLRHRAKTLTPTDTEAAQEVRARIQELRTIATQLAKYGHYLRDYYGKEAN